MICIKLGKADQIAHDFRLLISSITRLPPPVNLTSSVTAMLAQYKYIVYYKVLLLLFISVLHSICAQKPAKSNRPFSRYLTGVTEEYLTTKHLLNCINFSVPRDFTIQNISG